MLDRQLDDNLFEGFDQSQVLAIRDALQSEKRKNPQTIAAATRNHHLTRRAKSNAKLTEILPRQIEEGESWHVLSSGDIDVLSFTAHLISQTTYFEYLLIATWRINLEDLKVVRKWVESGLVERFDLIIDVRFQRLSPDEYQFAKELAREFSGRIVLARNHAKVTLLKSLERNIFYVLESSANVNTNHRLEQTTLHASRSLFEFYETFFKSLGRRPDDT